MIVTFNFIVSTSPYRKRPSWKIVNEKWPQFTDSLELPNLQADATIYEELNAFTSSLISSASSTFGLTGSSINPKYSRPWWSPECSRQVALRHKARRFYERFPTLYNKVLFNKQCAVTRRTIRQCKKTSWRKFVSNLNYQTPIATVWKTIKSLKGKSVVLTYPILENDSPVQTTDRKLELFGSVLGNTVTQISTISLGAVVIEDYINIACDDNSAAYNCPFALHEFRKVLK